MTTAVILLVYSLLSFLSLRIIMAIDYRRVDFADGLLLSTVFFIGFPLALIMISGEYADPEYPIPGYNPFADYLTTFNIFVGWVTVILFRYFWRNFEAKTGRADPSEPRDEAVLRFWFMVLTYLTITIVTFFVSGRSESGHWMDNLETAFIESPSLIVMANIANAYRAMIFGYLIYLFHKGVFSPNRIIITGAAVVIVDVLLSFNRITAAYYAIMLLIVLRKRIAIVATTMVVAAPFIMFFSNMWTTIRALALEDGYSVASVAEAFRSSLLDSDVTAATGRSLAEQSNGIFETSNLQVFSYIVNNVPDRLDPLWGWTLFLRPLTLFLPSSIWPDKPPVYGVLLGDSMLGNNVTLNSTPFGEAYGNFYFLWPLALVLALFLLSIVFQLLAEQNAFVRNAAFFSGFALGRFDLNFSAICIVSLVLLMLATTVGKLALRPNRTMKSLNQRSVARSEWRRPPRS